MVKKLLYSFVLLVVFLIHLSYLPNSFVWLDHGDIERGRAIVSLEKLPGILFTRFGQAGFYRPAISFTESLDYVVYKEWAPGFHFTNVVLHLFVVALVPLFLSAFFSFRFFEKLLAMLIVGVHPLTWLPVGAISYRSELLLALFLILTLYCHMKARTTGKSYFEFFAVISFFFALLSKETALFVVPALIILWEGRFLKVSKVPKVSKVSRALSLFLSEFIVLVLYFILRANAVPEMWRVGAYDLSWSEAIGTRVSLLLHQIFQLINPLKPHLSDAVMISGINGFVVLGCVGIMLPFLSRFRYVWLLLLITLMPSLGFIPVPRLGSPHYGYLALLGFAPFVIFFLRFVSSPRTRGSRRSSEEGRSAKRKRLDSWFAARNDKIRKLVYTICFLWIIVMSYTTFLSGFQFKNDLTLFAPEVKKDSSFLEGYFYLGNYFLLENNLIQAENMYTKALEDYPRAIVYSEKESVLTNLEIVRKELKVQSSK